MKLIRKLSSKKRPKNKRNKLRLHRRCSSNLNVNSNSSLQHETKPVIMELEEHIIQETLIQDIGTEHMEILPELLPYKFYDSDDNSEDNDSSSTYKDDDENGSEIKLDHYDNAEMAEEEDNETNADIDIANNNNAIEDSSSRVLSLKKKNLDEYLNTSYLQAYKAYYILKYGEGKAYEIKRIANLLEWSHFQVCLEKLSINVILEWTYKLFTQHINFIKRYTYTVMKCGQNMSDSTIKLFLATSLTPFWVWFTSYRDHCQTVFPIHMTHNMHFQHVIKDVRTDCNKAINRTRLTKKSKAYLVENHQIPEGDSVKTILQLIEKKYNQFKNIHENDIDNNIYSQFSKLLYASLYAGPMGRVKVFESLRVRDIDILLDKNKYFETTDFKTASTIGIQPVRFTSLTRY